MPSSLNAAKVGKFTKMAGEFRKMIN